MRDVPVPLVKMMLEASLEQFFQRDILKRNKVNKVYLAKVLKPNRKFQKFLKKCVRGLTPPSLSQLF